MTTPLSCNFQIILEPSQVCIVIFNIDDDTCNGKVDTGCTSFHPLPGYSLYFYHSGRLPRFLACWYRGIWIKLISLGFVICWFCCRFLSIFVSYFIDVSKRQKQKYLTVLVLLPTFAFNFTNFLITNNYHPKQIID